MITAKDIIYNQVENTKKDFDSKNSELLKNVESEIATAHVVKLIGLLKGADFVTKNKIYYLSLLLKAENILISSFHLVRQRAYIETFSLLRIAIEAIATAIHISKKKEALNNYLNNTYKSTSSISYSKKFIPLIGEIYGIFSKIAVHMNLKSYGPKMEINDDELLETIQIDFNFRKPNEELDQITLIATQLVATIVHRAFEIIFLKEKIYKGQSVLSFPGTDLIIFGKKYSDKINELYNKIPTLNKNENGCIRQGFSH